MFAFRRAAAGKSVEWKGKCLMKKLFALGMASVMALSLAACGGSASSAASGAADASSAATAEATGKKWVVATDTVFKPFEYTDASGNFVGIDVDILAAIAEDQGFEYELKSLGWDAAIAACQSGQADAMIAGASITDERKASGWMFSDGYYDSNQTLTVPEDSDIAGFADLSGKNVAVKTGTQGASYAESLKDEYGFTITYFEDSPTMYQAVLGGQCVGCFEDTPIMKASIKDGALALKVLEDTASDPGIPLGPCAESGSCKSNPRKEFCALIFKILANYGPLLLAAMGQTLLLALWSLFFACLIGLFVGILSVLKSRVCNIIATIFVDIIRGVPMIVLAFFVYFGVPMLMNDNLNWTAMTGSKFTFTALQAGIICLSLNCGAYMAEIIRAGIESVDKGQMEAARSLGLPYWKAMYKVVLPQAIRTMIPSIINQFIITLKDTSILSVIGFPELVNTAKNVNANIMRSLEVWFIVGVMYLIVITLLSRFAKRMERRLNRGRQ